MTSDWFSDEILGFEEIGGLAEEKSIEISQSYQELRSEYDVALKHDNDEEMN